MPKYNAHKVSRTQKRALRDFDGPVLVQARKVESMAVRLEQFVANCQKPATPEDIFLLEQVRMVCLFRQTQLTASRRVLSDSKLINERLKAIDEAEDKGRKLGFGAEDFFALNRWVIEQDKSGKLEFLLNQTTRRERNWEARGNES